MDPKGALKKTELFKDLNSLELIKVTEVVRRRFLEKGEAILAEGEEFGDDPSLYILVTGLVKVAVPVAENTELVLAILSPPDHFGEMSFMDGRPRSANVVAMEDSELFVLSHDALEGLLTDDRDLSLKFYRALSRSLVHKMRRMNDRVVRQRGAPPEGS
ncbi:MAG: cyclic nucleotide-binding domain-containing protein [Nitrospirae bacterium]|nr:cyclic nucleotide-binding domain-containing protein [Nitrospirota bacterium]MBI5696398.1 cyclic nucleotide-binding domain-containing protein [Nitrospirota bacterium]